MHVAIGGAKCTNSLCMQSANQHATLQPLVECRDHERDGLTHVETVTTGMRAKEIYLFSDLVRIWDHGMTMIAWFITGGGWKRFDLNTRCCISGY